ncbi:CDP-alcohol phosphatidyltransferase family protein [[Pseudopropionibacterium] massiliense]|uniref:CDP-alcohol phosphatidyltransferase family protein n=1 Tax=[Pseudopropionibacterium] massiliense TaxID=2220000 RepID=UPI00319E2B94
MEGHGLGLVVVKAVEPTQRWDTDRLLTIPNMLSFLRLLAVPVFGWLILVGHDVAAVILLAVSGATDWLDGFLARTLHQTSLLGARLDPVADRLYILTAVVVMTVRGLVPWWLLAVLAARDLLLLCLLPSLRRSGRVALPVNLVGKAGTMLLLLAFPLMLVGSSASFGLVAAEWLGWILALSGTIAYWAAGVLYVRGTVELARERGDRNAP